MFRNFIAAAFLPLALTLGACGTMQTPATTTTSTDPVASAVSQVSTAVNNALAPSSPSQQLITLLETTTPAKINADLDAATAYATSQGELLGESCFPALKAWFATLPPLPAGAEATRITTRPPPVGAFTALEYATVDRMAVQSSVAAWQTEVQGIIAAGLPPALQQGCGGYVVNQQQFLAELLAAIGAGAAANAVAPGIGAALPALGAEAGAALVP